MATPAQVEADPGPPGDRHSALHRPRRRSRWLILAIVAALAISTLVALGIAQRAGVFDDARPVGIYTGKERPVEAAVNEGRPVEVGLRFMVGVEGSIGSLRYYRGPGDKVAHDAILWASNGERLASGVFPARGSAGWQTVKLAKAVPVAPGSAYLVSYYAQNGTHTVQPGVFDNNKTIGGNLIFGIGGVYEFGNSMPDQPSPNDSAYYIDALFQPSKKAVNAAAASSGQTSAGATSGSTGSANANPPETITAPPARPQLGAPGATPQDTATSFAKIYTKWRNGPNPSGNPGYFPIGVFYQSFDRPTPSGEASVLAYIKAGINLQVGGYDCDNGTCNNGDRDPDVSAAVQYNTAAHPVACACDVMGASGDAGNIGPFRSLQFAASKSTTVGAVIKANFVIGYDEADMNQVNSPPGSDYSAPKVASAYAAIKAADPTRPVVAGFGKCFAIPDWAGCQAGNYSGQNLTNAQALSLYCANADMISSDYYANDKNLGDGPGYNYKYGQTVDNTRAICGAGKVIGFDVNTGDLGAGSVSPSDIKAATWDGIMHGANFVNYFVDDINSDNSLADENGLLQPEHSAALAQVTADNTMIRALAPWLNAPSGPGVTYTSTGGIPVATMLKTYAGHTYLFAMADGNDSVPKSGNTTVTLKFTTATADKVAVYGENRTTAVTDHSIHDSFAPYQLHVYQLS